MCCRCEDRKEFVSKNADRSLRGALVIFVLFSVSISALGISVYALLTVQNLFRDVDSLRSALRPSYGFKDGKHLSVGPIYEMPSDVNVRKYQRLKRNADTARINEKIDNVQNDTKQEFDSTSTSSKENQKELNTNGKPHNFETVKVDSVRGNSELEVPEDFSVGENENVDIFLNFFHTDATTKSSIDSMKSLEDVPGSFENNQNYPKSPIPRGNEADLLLKLKKNVTTQNRQHAFSSSNNLDLSSLTDEVDFLKDHHIKKKAVYYDDDVEPITRDYEPTQPVHRHKPRGRNDNQLEIIDEFSPQAGRLKSLTAIHLDGDTSQYMPTVHTNYKGNGHLRHLQKTYIDWKVSDWVETISASKSFRFKNGVVTVKDSGLYFVYAQIYYLDEHDSNGYLILKNSEKIMQCKVTAPSSEREWKGNTCYTGAVVFLENNDQISIDDISNGRFTLFVPGYSFFGMIKLGDVKGK